MGEKENITIWGQLEKLSVPDQFKLIYDKKIWTAGGARETICGAGSTLSWTINLRKFLPEILKKYKIKSFIDCGCGDCFWISKIDWTGIDYIGVDVVPEMIQENKIKHPTLQFVEKNIIDEIPQGDMIFVRDVLSHLSINNVSIILANIQNSNNKYLMASTYTGIRENVETLQCKFRKRNLALSPFFLKPPLEYINDQHNINTDRKIGIWKTNELF